MPIIGVECQHYYNGNRNVTFDECSKCANPACGAPAPLRRGIFANVQDRGRALSPSLLTRPCLLSAFLSATNDLYSPLQRLYQPNYGTAIHEFLDKHSNGEQTEIRLKSKKLGVSGQIDRYKPKKITDYKSTSNIGTKATASDEHAWQVRLYGYIAEENNLPVDELEICYLDPKRWLVLPVEMKSKQEIEGWAMPRIDALNKAFDGKLELEPTPNYLCNGHNRDKKIYCEAYNLCPLYKK